jgi:hypothetical protein
MPTVKQLAAIAQRWLRSVDKHRSSAGRNRQCAIPCRGTEESLADLCQFDRLVVALRPTGRSVGLKDQRQLAFHVHLRQISSWYFQLQRKHRGHRMQAKIQGSRSLGAALHGEP